MVEEDVVQCRGADGDVVDRDPGVVQPTDRVGNRTAALGDGDAHRAVLEKWVIAGNRGKRGEGLIEALLVTEVVLEPLAADLGLELGRSPFRDHKAMVEHRDPIGEPVGLVEILRGQQHRRPLRDERLDRVPQVDAAADVEAGCRLVEEQDRRPGEQRCREVEAATHPAGVRADEAVAGVGEIERGRGARAHVRASAPGPGGRAGRPSRGSRSRSDSPRRGVLASETRSACVPTPARGRRQARYCRALERGNRAVQIRTALSCKPRSGLEAENARHDSNATSALRRAALYPLSYGRVRSSVAGPDSAPTCPPPQPTGSGCGS